MQQIIPRSIFAVNNFKRFYSNSRYLLYLKPGDVGGKVFRKLLKGKNAFHQAHGWNRMESLVCEKTLPPTPCQIRKNRPGIPDASTNQNICTYKTVQYLNIRAKLNQ